VGALRDVRVGTITVGPQQLRLACPFDARRNVVEALDV